MKELTITKYEDGIKLSKYVKKVLPAMPDSLFHKLLRKKYFVINGIKAKGIETLSAGDKLHIFLGDETFDKYSVKEVKRTESRKVKTVDKSKIVYEDENIILYDKVEGILSQGDKSGDESVNSILSRYVGVKSSDIYTPSIVNRLDRNTSGIIIFAKTYVAAREISKMIKDQKLSKHYMALVNGVVKKDSEVLHHLYKKDEKGNKAIIVESDGEKEGYTEVKLIYKVVKRYESTTLLDIDLITGKSHQIRVQLSYIGHPIVCDKKYMDIEMYKKNVKDYGRKSQRLCCYMIKFGTFENETLKYLSNKVFKIESFRGME